MNARRQSLVLVALLASRAACGFDCDVAIPGNEGLPEELVSPVGFAWVGSPDLAARAPADGHWTAMGPDRDYRDKWWWWREGYRAHEEPRPELVIAASRLDAPAPRLLLIDQTTSAFGPDRSLMLLGMEFPSAGCWEVVGFYRGHELEFVFEVGSVEDEAGRAVAAEPPAPPVSPAPTDSDANLEAPDDGPVLDPDADFMDWLANETRCDVYEQDYLGAYAYAYAAELLGKSVSEARVRMENASIHLRPDQILAAERLAHEIAGR